ncbi:unnamed protein product [Orchesella dallaii]|uniref:Odorant receptor n=1 Tax=Orchesella dallaii TaxID=48710 RepID=A0ABP1QZM2_9HEXA
MPSPLVHHAYQLNQLINNHLFPYFLYWDNNNQKWKRETSWRRMIPYYIMGYLSVDVFCITFSVFVFLTAIFAPSALPFENTIMCALISGAFPMSLVIDIIVFMYSSELLLLLNWLDDVVADQFPSTIEIEWTIGNPRIFVVEVGKWTRGHAPDWIGLLVNCVVISYTSASIIMPLLVVWGNWDPLYLLAAILSSPQFGWLPDPDITSNSYSLCFRLMLSFLFSQAIFVNFKTFTIVITVLLFNVVRLLGRIQSNDLNYRAIIQYKQLYLANNVIIGTASIFFSQVLQAAFTAIVLGANIVILGIHWESLSMVYVGGMAFVIAVFGAFLTFISGCCWHEKSDEIFHSWRVKLERKRDVKGLKRRILSCRRLALRAGGVGVLDDGIQNTFFHSALTYTANLLLVMRNAASRSGEKLACNS